MSGVSLAGRIRGDDRGACGYMYLRGIGWAIKETPYSVLVPAECILSLECNCYVLIKKKCVCSLSAASMVVLPLCSVPVSSTKIL